MNNIFQAVILCGGYGTRIKKFTRYTPKSLIKFFDKNFIEYLIFYLSSFKIKEILLLIHYKQKLFRKLYHNKTFYGVKIKCIESKEALGTGGSIKIAEKFLQNYFLLCNGDTLFSINYSNFISKIDKKKTITTAYGIDFVSKKQKSSGNYIINRNKIFREIKEFHGSKFSLEKDLIPLIKNKKKRIFKNDYIDIGSYKGINYASLWIKKNIFRKFVIFDRDGVFNLDKGYVYKKNDFLWNKNIFLFLKYLNRKKYLIFIVTNQSGIGRGYYSINQFYNLNKWMLKVLSKKEVFIDEIFFSPYYKSSKNNQFKKGKKFRKPSTGFFDLIKKKYPIEMKDSFVVGDKLTDKLFSKNIGLRYFQVSRNSDILKILHYLKKNEK